MASNKFAAAVVALMMVSQTEPAFAASVASDGLISNRVALALPVSGEPGGGDPADAGGVTAAHAGSNWTVPLLLAAVAAAGVGIAVASGGGRSGNRGSGGSGNPVSP